MNIYNQDLSEDWGWFVDLENVKQPHFRSQSSPIRNLKTIVEDEEDAYEFYIKNQKEFHEEIDENKLKIYHILDINFICNMIFKMLKIFHTQYFKDL